MIYGASFLNGMAFFGGGIVVATIFKIALHWSICG